MGKKHYYMLLYFESLNAFYNCFHICKIVNCVQPDTYLKTQTLLCVKNLIFTFLPCRSSSPIHAQMIRCAHTIHGTSIPAPIYWRNDKWIYILVQAILHIHTRWFGAPLENAHFQRDVIVRCALFIVKELAYYWPFYAEGKH